MTNKLSYAFAHLAMKSQKTRMDDQLYQLVKNVTVNLCGWTLAGNVWLWDVAGLGGLVKCGA